MMIDYFAARDPFATLLGVFYLAMGLSILINQNGWRQFITLYQNRTDIAITTGVFTLLIGLTGVLFHHPENQTLAGIIVTILFWIIVIKGLLSLILPNIAQRLAAHKSTDLPISVRGGLALVIGLLLLIL